MTSWDERFQGHPIHDTIGQIKGAIGKATGVTQDEPRSGAAVRDGLHRVETIVAWIESALGSTDPVLVPQGPLNTMQKQLQTALGQLNEFASNRNSSHVENASNHAENAIAACTQLPRFQTPSDLDSVAESVSRFRSSIREYTSQLENVIASLRKDVEDVRSDINTGKNDIGHFEDRMDLLLTQQQEMFSAAQEDRRDKVDELVSELRAKFEAADEVRSQEHKARLDGVQKRHDATLSTLHSMKEKAEKLVQAVGSAGMTTGYQAVANRMARHAFWWQLGAVGAVLAFVLFGVWYVLPHVNGESAWTLVLVRVFMSIPLLLLAGFCIGQVRHFHRLEEANRSMELQLASLDPFVANLPDDLQRKIKQSAVTRFFPGHSEIPRAVEARDEP